MTSSRAAGVFNSLYFPFGFMKTTQCFYTFPGWEFGGCPEENGGRMEIEIAYALVLTLLFLPSGF